MAAVATRAAVLQVALVVTGFATATAVSPGGPKPEVALAPADSQDQRGNLVRREAASTDPSSLVQATIPPQHPETAKEMVDRILAGEVEGAAKEGDEIEGERLFWLEIGCKALSQTPELQGKFASQRERLGKIQCCKEGTDAKEATCWRKNGGSCFGGSNASSKAVTFMEAAAVCETSGFRLCTKEELTLETSLGCCKQGCEMDDSLVWTSTYSFKGMKESNEQLKTEIENVKEENVRIEQERQELEAKLGELVSAVNSSSIPEGYKPAPPPETQRHSPIHTITGEEAEAMAKENSRLWYEVEAMRRENDQLKDHIVAIVNGSIVQRHNASEQHDGQYEHTEVESVPLPLLPGSADGTQGSGGSAPAVAGRSVSPGADGFDASDSSGQFHSGVGTGTAGAAHVNSEHHGNSRVHRESHNESHNGTHNESHNGSPAGSHRSSDEFARGESEHHDGGTAAPAKNGAGHRAVLAAGAVAAVLWNVLSPAGVAAATAT